MRNLVLMGDVREKLKEVPDGTVQTCVTSPPYFGLRNYGHEGQIGLEETPESYVAELVQVFREVRRVLRDDGTLWLNLGDSYSRGDRATVQGHNGILKTEEADPRYNFVSPSAQMGDHPVIKPKDLIGIPWRVAFALQADGWYLRSDIIWAKNAVMPESVRDRPTKAHEYIFLLTKNERYFYDDVAVKEPSVSEPHAPGNKHRTQPENKGSRDPALDPNRTWGSGGKRNRRTVWTINPSPYREAHFATFPEELPEVCIRAGTSEKGACPTCGAPWARVVAHGEVLSEGGSDNGSRAVSLESVSPFKTKLIDSYNTGRMTHREKLTTGWEPTCTCAPLEPISCVVLDPFSGSGTTLAVAKMLRRDYLGVELNPEYHRLIEKRLRPAIEAEQERQGFDALEQLSQE